MWYQNRYELDQISSAGRYHYFADNGNPIVRMNASFWLECEKDDTAFTQPAINTGNWEAWVATAIMRELHEQGNETEFVDIGANNGYYSMMVSSAGYGVTAFEPNPTLVEMLERSAKLNNISQSYENPKSFGVNQVALSDVDPYDKNGKPNLAQLYTHSNHSGASSLEGEGEGFTVRLSNLDFEIMPLETTVLKVDVEGHERNVWNGSSDLRQNEDTIWFVEWVPVRWGKEYNREWLTEVLQTHNLQMVNYDGTLRPVGIEEALQVEFETIVFRKRN